MKQYFLLIIGFMAAQCVYAQTPVISSFSPTSGAIGSTVTINGSNFGALPADNIVYFGPVRATVLTASATTLTVAVPFGAGYTPISITANTLTGNAKTAFIVTFAGGTLQDSAFSQRIDFPWPNDQVYSATTADLDNDGKPDIIVPVQTAGTISILQNISVAGGAISFAAPISFTAGTMPLGIVAGDLDGDGKLDLITANYKDSCIIFFRNTSTPGNISFAPRDSIRTGPNPSNLAIGDIDGDGKADIVYRDKRLLATNIYAIHILRNTTTGGVISFAPRVDFALSDYSLAGDIVIGDLNGDGKADIATSTSSTVQNTYPVDIFINNGSPGTISFPPYISPISDGLAFRMALGDLDNNGFNDIITANATGKDFSIYKNTTSGTAYSFSLPPNLSCSGAPYGLALADMDGDGKVDMAEVHNTATKFISVYKNTGSGSISLSVRVSLDTADVNQSQPRGLMTEDFNADGLPDMIFTSTNKLVVLQSRCTSPIISSFAPTSGVPGTVVTVQGVNFTNITGVSFGGVPAASFTVTSATTLTAVVGAGGNTGSVTVSNLTGSGTLQGFTFNPPAITSVSPETGIVGSSVTITGTNFGATPADNIVFFGAVKANIVSATSTVITVQVPAGGTFLPVSVTANTLTAFSRRPFRTVFPGALPVLSSTAFAPKIDFPVRSSGSNCYISDLDGDGKNDIITMSSAANSISILRNTCTPGHMSFAPTVNYIGQSNVFLPDNVTVTDLDGDGKPDIVVTQTLGASGANIYFYRNTCVPGTLSFEVSSYKFPIFTYQPSSASIADMDRDGRPDVVLSTNGNSFVFIVMKNMSTPGHLSFVDAFERTLSVGVNTEVSTADYDGDGIPDIVYTNTNSSSISVYRNTTPVPGGQINFGAALTITSGANPYSVTSADLDGDNKTDIVTANAGGNSVSAFLNNSVVNSPAFLARADFNAGSFAFRVNACDIDGDGKPDILVADQSVDSVSVLKNNSTIGSLAFGPKISFKTGLGPRSVQAGDLDGDGKPDLVVGNTNSPGFISVYRNRTGEPDSSSLCPNGNMSFTASIIGSSYQWQMNDGSGFVNISDNANYSGTASATLLLSNIPSSFYGYQYRCVTDAVAGGSNFLKFVNQWTGAANNIWENPANWSCGAVPDAFSDVFINSGNVLLNANTSIGSLHTGAGAVITIGAGVHLTIIR